MPLGHLIGKESPTVVYYKERIQTIADQLLPPDVSIERGLEPGAQLLKQTHDEHGDKPYHNGEHPLVVLPRHWKLLTIIRATLPDKLDDSVFDESITPVCGHDVFNDIKAPPGQNEHLSGVLVYDFMLGAGYSRESAQHGFDMVEGTAVRRDASGVIVQNNLRTGSKYPAKWALANADINGIPMEGIARMVSDALDLYLEFTDTPVKDFLRNPAEAARFFRTQAKFLEDRLAAVDDDLSYYFSDEEKEKLRQAFDKEFTGTTRDAISAARMLFSFPEVPELVIRSALSKADIARAASAEQLEHVKRHVAELLHRNSKVN